MGNIKLEDLLKKFELYFIPKVNVAIERNKFFTCEQMLAEYTIKDIEVLTKID